MTRVADHVADHIGTEVKDSFGNWIRFAKDESPPSLAGIDILVRSLDELSRVFDSESHANVWD